MQQGTMAHHSHDSATLEGHLQKYQRFMEILRGLSPNTSGSYIPKIREFYSFLERQGGPCNILRFSREDVETFLEHLFYKGNNNRTRATKLTALRRWSRFLCYERLIAQDPTVEIPSPKVGRRFPQILTKHEILRLLAAINPDTEKGLRNLVVFILAAFCGLRISEIVNLNVNDIVEREDNPGQGGLNVQIEDSKHHNSRIVTLWKVPSGYVRQLVGLRSAQGAKGSDPLILTYTKSGRRCTGHRVSSETLSFGLKRYAGLAGIKRRVHFHMLRAAHATSLRSIQNYDLPSIASRLGHKSVETTARFYLASWDRVSKRYPSLASYWREFGPSLWNHSKLE